jgi:hypothetical protein
LILIGWKAGGTGADFLRVLRFPLPSIPPTSPHSASSIIIRGWYNRPVAASVIVDSVPPQKGRRNYPTLIRNCSYNQFLKYINERNSALAAGYKAQIRNRQYENNMVNTWKQNAK